LFSFFFCNRLKIMIVTNERYSYSSNIVRNKFNQNALTDVFIQLNCPVLWEFAPAGFPVGTSCILLMYEPRRETCSLSGSNWLRPDVGLDRIGLLIIPVRNKSWELRKGTRSCSQISDFLTNSFVFLTIEKWYTGKQKAFHTDVRP